MRSIVIAFVIVQFHNSNIRPTVIEPTFILTLNIKQIRSKISSNVRNTHYPSSSLYNYTQSRPESSNRTIISRKSLLDSLNDYRKKKEKQKKKHIPENILRFQLHRRISLTTDSKYPYSYARHFGEKFPPATWTESIAHSWPLFINVARSRKKRKEKKGKK